MKKLVITEMKSISGGCFLFSGCGSSRGGYGGNNGGCGDTGGYGNGGYGNGGCGQPRNSHCS